MAACTMNRTLELCADDYGQSAAINAGILKLVNRPPADKRLSAVSCLVNMPAWDNSAAQALLAQRRKVGAGLHFNLTEGRPLSKSLLALWPHMPTLQQLITWAHLRQLPVDALRDEWQAQLQAFEQAYSRPPAHIDGHQHVHHLPQVRDLLMQLLTQKPGIAVRHTGRVCGPGFAVKRLLIEGTGGRELGRQLEAVGRAANTHLLGVYDFQKTNYRGRMQAWLKGLPARGGLIFCHPGEINHSAVVDAIGDARVQELAYLDSADFSADLAAAGVTLA
jgi:chitin disaccharide deacetylase